MVSLESKIHEGEDVLVRLDLIEKRRHAYAAMVRIRNELQQR